MHRVVLITAPDDQVATGLARSLVEARLAACVNIVPAIRSIYRWQGEVCDDAETLLIVKTTADRLDALTTHVQSHHPYDVPEVIALPIDHGSSSYLSWLSEQVADPPPESLDHRPQPG